MKKKRRILPFYFCMIFVLVFSQAIHIYGLNDSASTPALSGPYITLDLDKTDAAVGDIIKAGVRINDIDRFVGCHVNIKYDPSVLQAVNPVTGDAFTDKTIPPTGNILINEEYLPYFYLIDNNINDGILNFARMYSNLQLYVANGNIETTGIIAEVGFKVISAKTSATSIRFEDTPSMEEAISGTSLFDWDFVKLENYSVIQAPEINIISTSTYKISGYISPDFKIDTNQPADIKEGFKVEVIGTDFRTQTNTNGYFEIKDIPFNTQGYSLKISKDGYLYRIINNVSVNKDVQIASPDAPLAIWAGDLKINGVQDNAINMTDIMEITKGFNSLVSDERYNVNYDINKDKAINLVDIIILAKHFNKSVNDYPNI